MRFSRRYKIGFNLCGAPQSAADILPSWIAQSRDVCTSCLAHMGRVAPSDVADQSLQAEHIQSIKRET